MCVCACVYVCEHIYIHIYVHILIYSITLHCGIHLWKECHPRAEQCTFTVYVFTTSVLRGFITSQSFALRNMGSR